MAARIEQEIVVDAPVEYVWRAVSVQEVEPARVFAYRWHHPESAAAKQGNSLLVEFTLIPERDGTRLRVTETGLDSMSWPVEERDDYADQHNQGWSTYLGRLREHVARQSTTPAP
jgi:uncharacterized protein YndB with AHSA1/START domain